MRDSRMICNASAFEVLGTDKKVAKLIRSCTVLMQRTELTALHSLPNLFPFHFQAAPHATGAANLNADSSSSQQAKT